MKAPSAIPTSTTEDRFWAKVDMREGYGPNGDCWLWIAGKSELGYGRFLFKGRNAAAHRVAYLINKGAIPKGMSILHSCDNRACCNPAHLLVGTHTENMRDMSAKGRSNHQRKTHCPKGHEYSAENTILRDNGTHRVCKTCDNNRTKLFGRAYRAKKKEERLALKSSTTS